MKRYIVGLGEALWDVLPEGKKLGGAPANFAYHAGQFLGSDNTIAISALGEDALADETVEALKEHNLNYLMPRVPYPTGTVQVTLTGDGIPTYEIKENVAWDNIPFTPEMEEIAKNARAVCFGSLAQRNVVSRENIRKFLDTTPKDCLRICDINLRQQFYSKDVLVDSFNICNILKINDEELVVVNRMFGYDGLDMRQTCEKIVQDYHLKMLVLTCGTNGSYVFTDDGLTSFQDTPKVEVADTVGAGDSFTGSFCACVLNGKPVQEAHKIAVQVSAFVCTQNGAMPIAAVRQEYMQTTCYPPGKLIFNAFNLCPFDKVKVVIIGQDPYHEPGQAHGLSFSVQDGVQFPPSLQNIFKEIQADLGTPIPDSGNLTRWAEQGVLLLNASLTVRAHQANSHSMLGWQKFTDAAIQALATHREHLVYMLWGGYARSTIPLH